MKVFEQRKSRLATMPFPMKLIFGLFCLLILGGIVLGVILGVQKAGITPSSIALYYRGDGEYFYAKSVLELLEITHFHAISMGVVFLILTHLLLMTSCSAWVIMGVIFGMFFSLVGMLVLPWLITFYSAWFASLKLIVTGVFLGAILLSIGLELWDMMTGKT